MEILALSLSKAHSKSL